MAGKRFTRTAPFAYKSDFIEEAKKKAEEKRQRKAKLRNKGTTNEDQRASMQANQGTHI